MVRISVREFPLVTLQERMALSDYLPLYPDFSLDKTADYDTISGITVLYIEQ
jgi:hypothetical protein